MRHLRAWIIAAITVLMAASAFAAPTFPALTGQVVDQAHVLTADQVTMLTNKLATYQQQSGHQVAVATVGSLQGLDIRDYGYQLGRAWGLGQKGKDDGVLVLVAPSEHKVSIEVGYGLEGDLTDATSSVIINQHMLPKFRTGDYIGGLWAGTDDIAKVVGGQGDDIVKAGQQQAVAAQEGNQVGNFGLGILFVIFFFVVLIIVFNASRGGGVYRSGGGFGSGGGFSGGGGGFSNGGGFSGGGGSFGGGGASGGW